MRKTSKDLRVAPPRRPKIRQKQLYHHHTGPSCRSGIAPEHEGAKNITELEAMNVVIAVHTLVSAADRGQHINIKFDNMATVQVFKSGRAYNPVLQECARALWMAQALTGVHITYDHTPDIDNCTADALSRAHLSEADGLRASSLVTRQGLKLILPCLFFIDNSDAPLCSRSGHLFYTTPLCPRMGRGPQEPWQITSRRHQPTKRSWAGLKWIHWLPLCK